MDQFTRTSRVHAELSHALSDLAHTDTNAYTYDTYDKHIITMACPVWWASRRCRTIAHAHTHTLYGYEHVCVL